MRLKRYMRKFAAVSLAVVMAFTAVPSRAVVYAVEKAETTEEQETSAEDSTQEEAVSTEGSVQDAGTLTEESAQDTESSTEASSKKEKVSTEESTQKTGASTGLTLQGELTSRGAEEDEDDSTDDYPDEIVFPINVLDFPQDDLLFEFGATWNGSGIDSYLDLYHEGADNRGKGLVAEELSEDGTPLYKQETVERIAKYVQESLIGNVGNNVLNTVTKADGTPNYLSMRNYIKSEIISSPAYTQEAEVGYTLGGRAALGENGRKIGNLGGQAGQNPGSVSYNYNCSRTGYHTLRFYVMQDDDRWMRIQANGMEYDIQCDNTGGWNVASDAPMEVEIYLKKGDNTITFTGRNGEDAPDLDRFEIQEKCLFEGEEGEFAGQMSASMESPLCSNGGRVGYGRNGDGSDTFTFDSAVEGDYDLLIYYTQSSADRSFVISINGVDRTTDGFPGAPGNDTPYATPYVLENVHINQGQNTIVFKNNPGAGNPPNLDKFEIGHMYPIGNYAESKAKFDATVVDGNGNQTTRGWTDITTCMDYAYFMTKYLFLPNNTINQTDSNYTKLVYQKIDESGKTAYTFAADQHHSYIDLVFNKEENTIRNIYNVEAEDGILEGGATINANGYASNEKTVNNLGVNGSTDTLTFYMKEAGVYDLNIYYATDGARDLSVTVNGEERTITCPSTGAWTMPNANDNNNRKSAVPVVLENVSLNAGKNIVVLGGVGRNPAPNVDFITIDNSDTTAGDDVRGGGSMFAADDAQRVLEPTIDVDMGGDDGKNHNFHYTVSSQSYFIFKYGQRQFFYFSGDDDVYVYVNRKLLLDIGGAHEQLDGSLNLDILYLGQQLSRLEETDATYNATKDEFDALCAEEGYNEDTKAGFIKDWSLENGAVVDLSFFYMERHSTASNFYSRMNFKLASDEITTDFQYRNQEIPYGYVVPLTYKFTTMREATVNRNLNFRDDLGNHIGEVKDAEGNVTGFECVFGDGVLLYTDTDAGGDALKISVTKDNAIVPEKSKVFVFPDYTATKEIGIEIEENLRLLEEVRKQQEEEEKKIADALDALDPTAENYQDEYNVWTNQQKDLETRKQEYAANIQEWTTKKTNYDTAWSDYMNRADVKNAFAQLEEFFKSLELEKGETLEISGMYFDTSARAFEMYTELPGSDDVRQEKFNATLTYDSEFNGGTMVVEKNDTFNVAIRVGRIFVMTDKGNNNLKPKLYDYGAFKVERDSAIISKQYYDRTDLTNLADDEEYWIMTLPQGIYTLTLDDTLLRGYEVTVYTATFEGDVASINKNNIMIPENAREEGDTIDLTPTPVYDGNSVTWSYPKVVFILNATREINPLMDLT